MILRCFLLLLLLNRLLLRLELSYCSAYSGLIELGNQSAVDDLGGVLVQCETRLEEHINHSYIYSKMIPKFETQ